MLVTERERTTLYNGKVWRTHYWRLKKNNILRYANKERKPNSYVSRNKHYPKETSEDDIYETLSEDIWTKRKIEIPTSGI